MHGSQQLFYKSYLKIILNAFRVGIEITIKKYSD